MAALLTLAAAQAGRAQPPAAPRELLNSERIEQKFGSYGIDVLESGAEFRVSNLFSTTNGERTTRTFAVVRYPDQVDPAFASEHAEIVKGGSIGAIFAKHGWTVRKSHLEFGEIAASPRLATLMRIAPGTALAEHVYVLDIVKGDMRFQYAALVEIHHPDYLRRQDLAAFYGVPDARGREPLLAMMLATAASKARD